MTTDCLHLLPFTLTGGDAGLLLLITPSPVTRILPPIPLIRDAARSPLSLFFGGFLLPL